jgi:hypothetical protein
MFRLFCDLFPFFLELYYPLWDSSSSNLDRSYSNKSQSVKCSHFHSALTKQKKNNGELRERKRERERERVGPQSKHFA